MKLQLKPKKCGECRFLYKSNNRVNPEYGGSCVLANPLMAIPPGRGNEDSPCDAGIKIDEALQRAE